MKILLVHRFFYPDSPPYAKILDDMRQFFITEGHTVDVLSSKPSYKKNDRLKQEKFVTKETVNSTIFRLPVLKSNKESLNKLFNFLWFPFVVFCFLLFKKKYDIVTVSTNPPVLLAFSVALAAKIKGFKLIYHCMDIHPEIGNISGEFKNKTIFNILKKMDNFTCRTASKIVVLSSDMKNSLLKRDPSLETKIEIINNYDLSDGEKSTETFFTEEKGIKRIVFTGNLGRFQNLESLINAIKTYGCIENFELIFVGEGKSLNSLKELASGFDCIKFIPHQPVSVARKIIEEAHMGIVSLENEIIKYAYPSKTMTYLAEGTPILVCVTNKCDLSTFILENKLGIVVNPDKEKEIYEAFKKLVDNKIYFNKEHTQNIFETNFSKNNYQNKFLNLLNTIMEIK